MHLSRIFTLVGIVFGAMFVFINAGDLPDPWSIIARVTGGIAVIVAIWLGLVRHHPTDTVTPDAQAIRAYWMSLLAELVAIPVGALVLNIVFDQPQLIVLWVVFVVGAHFLPARAFGVPNVSVPGGVLIALAVIGTIGTLAFNDIVAPLTAVITGFVLLAYSATTSWIASDRAPA